MQTPCLVLSWTLQSYGFLSLSSSGLNVDRSLNLTVVTGLMLLCARWRENTHKIIIIQGFCVLHLGGPFLNNKGLCSKMISLKAFRDFWFKQQLGVLLLGEICIPLRTKAAAILFCWDGTFNNSMYLSVFVSRS